MMTIFLTEILVYSILYGDNLKINDFIFRNNLCKA